ncbi:MAG TPA: EthD domain-containing protein [Solirubrobacteraceae bacterium]|nr:EthD domain-containing protein [Solirubrobacteraceae bacterium]
MPENQRRPMIKLVFTLRRREDMTREQFQRYWREQHAALVKRHADALRIRRYVQVHARDTDLDEALAGPRGSEPRFYDGVAELWWDSLEELVAAFSSDEGQAAGQELLEDEQRFIDLPRSPLWLGEENVVIDAA